MPMQWKLPEMHANAIHFFCVIFMKYAVDKNENN